MIKKKGKFLKAVASEKIIEILGTKGIRETKRVAVDLFRKIKGT